MTSLVSEILSSAGELQDQEIGSKVELLKEKVETMKSGIQEHLQKRYVDFLPSSIKTDKIFQKIISYESEVQSLTYVFENELSKKVEDSAEEFDEMHRQLTTAKSALSVANSLISLHDGLLKSRDFFQKNDFEGSVRCLQLVQISIVNLQQKWQDQIKLLQGLNTEFHIQNEKLKYDMGEIWKDYLQWKISERSSESDETVELSMPNHPIFSFKSLCLAMQQLKYLPQLLQLFCKRFVQYILEPIIKRDCNLTIRVDGERTCLKLVAREICIQTPHEVFHKLILVFELLNGDIFGGVCVDEGSGEKLMKAVGRLIYTDLCQLLIKHCLAPSVPSRRQDLKDFEQVVCDVTQFHQNLTEFGVFEADEKSILSYAKDVDSLFADRMCQVLLAEARQLMLVQLHKSTKVGTTVKEEDKSHSSLFAFPTCEISESAKMLVEMLIRILEDAVNSSASCAMRLVITIRNILAMYCDIVTCYHKESLDSMPLHVALFHNNCMYIAHHTMTLGQQFNPRLPSPLNTETITFVDFVPKLREGGTSVFLAQMRTQKKNILNCISQAGDFRSMAMDDDFVNRLEKGMKQCVLQLEHLSKVWKGVLCSNVHSKVLGTLINSILEELICQLTSLEDLSATQANHLIRIFTNFIEKTQPLFTTEDTQTLAVEVRRAVRKWTKFTELLLVLNSSLQNIVDRWASGKGPLAEEFRADEIKQLIRALFQNTDRRAAALAKIK